MTEVGQPNENPLPGNVAWEHPRVKAAADELFAASDYHQKARLEHGFSNYAASCCRLENAAIAFANTVREYTLS